jgi:formate dehydrogenase maturation protein FdhE
MQDTTEGPRPIEILERLAGLSARVYASPDYVRFRVALLEAQTAVAEALADGAASPSRTAPARWKDEGAALEPEDVAFNCGLLDRLLGDLTAALDACGDTETLSQLAAATVEEPALLEAFARAAAFGPDQRSLASFGARLQAPPDGLLFFGRALAAPFVDAAVQAFKASAGGAPPASQGCGCCPYCGSGPGLAKLRGGDGRRILFCALCGEGWGFARMACPFCGDEGPLDVLSPGVQESRWTEACTRCRRHLKTVDQRKLPEDEDFIPLVEATATLYLDLIAEQRGCTPGLPYSALR